MAADYTTVFTIDSNMFYLFDIKGNIRPQTLELLESDMSMLCDVVAQAYEYTLMDIIALLPYTYNFDEGESVVDYSLGEISVEMNVETDIASIFDIHKDAFTKCKDKFSKWLEDNALELCSIPDSIEEFFKKLEGQEVDAAFGAFLAFYYEENIDDGTGYFANAFTEYVDRFAEEYQDEHQSPSEEDDDVYL